MTAALDEVGGQPHTPGFSTPGKDPVPIVREAVWGPGPVWTGGKSRPHRDSIPDLPACSQSLVSGVLFLVLSRLVGNCCWLTVCIVVVDLCVCCHLMCICCIMCVFFFFLL